MTGPAVILALDLGTSSVKATAVDAEGSVVKSAAAGYPTLRPEAEAAEQAPGDWRAAVSEAVVSLNPRTLDIAAIAVTGQMHGTVLLGKHREPLAPAIIWSDQRGATDAEALNAEDDGTLRGIAGSPVASGFQAATIRWLRRVRPDLWAATERVLLPKDYLLLWLSGELASDPSDAAGTWLLNSAKQDWSPALCASAGVEVGHLPPLARPGAVIGALRPEVANQFGVPAGIPIVMGGGDAPCAAIGAGIVDPSGVLIMLSTGAQVIRPATHCEPPAEGLHIWPAALPESGHWNRMSATLNAGVAVEWLKRLLNERDVDRLASGATDPHPPIFLPYLTGERDPAVGTSARAAFLGLTAAHGPADLAYAVLEGIAFSLVPAFDRVRGSAGAPPRVWVAGGGSRMPMLVRLIATALDLPLVPCQMADLSALGAAMLGAHALGLISLPAGARTWREPGQPVQPNATMRETLQTRLAISRELNDAIQPALKRLAAPGTRHTTGGAEDR